MLMINRISVFYYAYFHGIMMRIKKHRNWDHDDVDAADCTI